MSLVADTKFKEVISTLKRRGIAGAEYHDLIRVYAEAFAQFMLTTEKISAHGLHGLLVKSPREGLIVSPLVTARDSAAATMDRIGRQLGLSPAHGVASPMLPWAEYAEALGDD